MSGLALGSTVPAWVLVATITEAPVYDETPRGSVEAAKPYPGPPQYILPSAQTPTPTAGSVMAAGAYTVLTPAGVRATAAPGVQSPASTWYVWRTYPGQPSVPGSSGPDAAPGGDGTARAGKPAQTEEPGPATEPMQPADPTPTPADSETPTPTPTGSETPRPTPGKTENPTPTPTPTSTPTATATPTEGGGNRTGRSTSPTWTPPFDV